MNPLDFSGPQFLLFYLAFAVAVLVALRVTLVLCEPVGGAMDRISDPYAVAFLRGGQEEAVRVALALLIERGVLRSRDALVERGERAAHASKTRAPLEAALVDSFASPRRVLGVWDLPSVTAACRPYRERLATNGLTQRPSDEARAKILMLVASVLLLGLAAAKVAVALERGRHNIEFLIVLALIATALTWKATRRRRTRAGDRVLRDLRTLFGRAKERAVRGHDALDPADRGYMLALYGWDAIGSLFAADTQSALRKVIPASGGSSCSSGGSSCGSGSGCGGGGGGGCGGCGS